MWFRILNRSVLCLQIKSNLCNNMLSSTSQNTSCFVIYFFDSCRCLSLRSTKITKVASDSETVSSEKHSNFSKIQLQDADAPHDSYFFLTCNPQLQTASCLALLKKNIFWQMSEMTNWSRHTQAERRGSEFTSERKDLTSHHRSHRHRAKKMCNSPFK